MDNDTMNTSIVIDNLFEKWRLSDAQKSGELQITDVSDLNLLLASQPFADDDSLVS
jgi:hypothetical protein